MVVVRLKGQACDLRCIFCDFGLSRASRKNLTPGNPAPLHEALAALRSEARRGGKSSPTRTCILTGHEPLADPILFDVLDEAYKLRFQDIRLNTNGIRLADLALARRLARYGVISLDLPIYGSNAKIHDRVTGVPGSFKRLMQALRHVRRCLGVKIAFLHTVVLKENLSDLPRLCALVTGQLGVPLQVTLPYNHAPDGSARTFLAVCPPLSRLRKVLETIPPGPYLLRGLPPCLCPAHLAWPGDDAAHNLIGRGPWPPVPRVVRQLASAPSNRFRQARSCRGCEMSAACQGVPEEYLRLPDAAQLCRRRAVSALGRAARS
jgi:MoaA/NifB/PqqE/SkfB family radical SAM enzyme